MKINILSLILLLGVVLFPQESFSFAKHPGKMKQIAIGTYAVGDSISSERFELAKEYNEQVQRIVPPPKDKDRIKISPLSKTTKDKATGRTSTQKYAVLPANSSGTVVKKDSEEFKELIRDRELLKAYQEGEKQWIKYSDTVNEAMRQEQQKVVDLGKTIEKKEQEIVKKEKKIAELSKYRGIVFGVIAIIAILIVIYVISLFIRLAIAGSRMM
jgi:uncharacterized membrane protein